jgi:hypothetical protein
MPSCSASNTRTISQKSSLRHFSARFEASSSLIAGSNGNPNNSEQEPMEAAVDQIHCVVVILAYQIRMSWCGF